MRVNTITKGQGLLETVVAIGVITTGLISVITLVISNLTAQREAALRYRAVNFAREGLEIARNIRDSNWLAGESPWEGLGSPEEAILEFDDSTDEWSFGSAISADAIDNTRLCLAPSGLYVQREFGCPESYDETPFYRTIELQTLACDRVFSRDDELCTSVERSGVDPDAVALTVVARVRWSDAGRSREVELTENLYDWR